MKPTLPNTLQELIEVALADAEACKADPKYVLNMSVWHTKIDDKCYVCFAGAVMAQTLKVPTRMIYYPADFDYDTEHKLEALNYVRMGTWPYAFEPKPDGFPCFKYLNQQTVKDPLVKARAVLSWLKKNNVNPTVMI